jgi:hypothetical protein
MSGEGIRTSPPPETTTASPSVNISSPNAWIAPDQTYETGDISPDAVMGQGRTEDSRTAHKSFDSLVSPSRSPGKPRDLKLVPGNIDLEHRRQGEDRWPAESGWTRRAGAYIKLGKLASGVTILAALEFGSNLGQAIGVVAFGGIEIILDGPSAWKALRATPKPPPDPARHRR